MEIDILRAELERLFELDELMTVSKGLLGFDPDEIGGTAGKGSFVRALTEHCIEKEALEALCDIVLSSKSEANPKLRELCAKGIRLSEDLAIGSRLGAYTISRKLGEGTAATSYVARDEDREVRLKVLRHEATRDRRGLHRYLAATRLTATASHPALPSGVGTGVADGRHFVVHDHVEAQPLAARIGRTGPMHLNEARTLLKPVLEALAALHEQRLTHGNLKLENVLVGRNGEGDVRVVLVDACGDRLRSRAPANGHIELLSVSSPKTIAPEQLRGEIPTERSDLYSFGALLFEVLTGKSLFEGKTAMDVLVAHLVTEPRVPSEIAPRGWVTRELDEFVLKLLAKDPAKRPASARSVIDALDALGRASRSGEDAISEDDLVARIETVLAHPEDEEAALLLEAAVDSGADPRRVAETFREAAERLQLDDEQKVQSSKAALLYRAGRLFSDVVEDFSAAEAVFVAIVALDPGDDTAQTKLEELRRRQGKYDELVESLLERAEAAGDGTERAAVLARIGRIYVADLNDDEQALVAFTQAFCEDPSVAAYAAEIERLAGASNDAWSEVLGACTEASTQDAPAERKNPLFLRMGQWYGTKLPRPDLALTCFQAVLATDPGNGEALAGLASLYRKAQQWSELASTLLRRADIVADPEKARDLRCQAAEILETQLNDPGGARDLYAQVLADDPGHPSAAEPLARLYEQGGDYVGLVKLWERQREATKGEENLRIACRIAEIYEVRLHDDDGAIERFRAVLDVDSDFLTALKGLDRLYSKAGRFTELLDNLRHQVRLAATPRQTISLYERIASIYDEEFLDHEKAAEALERILDVDPSHDPSLTNLARHYRALERWEELVGIQQRQLGFVTDEARRLEIALARAHVLGDQIGDTERAIEAYEKVLEIDPEHAGALESLAHLRETAGQEDRALEAILALADKAETSEARAEQHLRAAKLLESRGDRDRAIDQYKLALDANPKDSNISQALRNAYVARGDSNAAVELIAREIDQTEGDRQKARLAAEMAELYLKKLDDEERAERAAQRSLDYDPTNVPALTLLSDLAFSRERFVEASSYYEKLAHRADGLPHDEAVRVLLRFVDSLSKAGSTEKALAPMDILLRLAPDDARAMQRVAAVTFEHGSPKRAFELYRDLLDRLGSELGTDEKALATYRLGESARRTGDLEAAIGPLEEAADLEPSNPLPLVALASAYEQRGDFENVVDAKTRHLDLAEGDDRVRLLIEIGAIASSKLDDRTLATKSLVAALDERPDDRKLLMRLMQLYSEDKDWSKLIDVVIKLAEFVEEKAQKAKYLQTAAMVAGREMGDFDRAIDFHEMVLDLDPKNEKSIDETIELLKMKGDYASAAERLKAKAQTASSDENTARMLEAFNELGHIYKEHLGRIGHAIDAHEAAQTLEPENQERNELLAELYAANPSIYFEKAVAAQMLMLRQNPYRESSYKLLRKLYTDSKRADPAWCLCQALYVLKLAEPDEERFFRRMRSEDPAYAQDVLGEDDWLTHLLHPDADTLLTSVFALIEPAIIATRSQSLAELGYDPRYAIDPEQHPYPVSQTLHYAAGVMGMELPPTFESPSDPGGLAFLHADTPSLVLGHAALASEVPPQAAAFIAGRHLSYYRPGLYMRHLVPSGHGLKSWLFAAIKMNAPQFPVAVDMQGPVQEATAALETNLSAQVRDHLARIVSKLLQSGRALDLRKWVQGIDLTADRAGFLLAHDLETAIEIIRASEEGASSAPQQARLRELVLFAISDHYFKLRERLRITIDG